MSKDPPHVREIDSATLSRVADWLEATLAKPEVTETDNLDAPECRRELTLRTGARRAVRCIRSEIEKRKKGNGP